MAGDHAQAMVPRHLILPDRGLLLVSTDLHGNHEDFLSIKGHFDLLCRKDPGAHWLLLGDVVHGPDEQARKDQPDFYDFEDGSFPIIRDLMDLQTAMPERIHYILGNHDHAHVGGPPVAKFYPDEARAFEERLSPGQVNDVREFFEQALLAAAAPCGLLFTHGVPDENLRDLKTLDSLGLRPRDGHGQAVLAALLRAYGQEGEIVDRMLAGLGQTHPELDLRMVVHGHDRDPEGFFVEEGNQLCPVIFGALRDQKRFLALDLSQRYEGPGDFREGKEIRRLYPGS